MFWIFFQMNSILTTYNFIDTILKLIFEKRTKVLESQSNDFQRGPGIWTRIRIKHKIEVLEYTFIVYMIWYSVIPLQCLNWRFFVVQK